MTKRDYFEENSGDYDDNDAVQTLSGAIEYDVQVNGPLPFQNLDLGISRKIEDVAEASVDTAIGAVRTIFKLFGG